MKRRALLLITSVACAATAPAQNHAWLGGATAGAWTDGGNWWDLTGGGTGVGPAAGGLAILGYPAPGVNPWPVVTTVPYTMDAPLGYLGIDWWEQEEGNPVLTINGGGLEVANTWMNYLGTETATIHITGGGYMRSLVGIQMAMTHGGTSQVDIDSGFLYTPNLVFGPGTSNIDLEPGAYLYLGGDQTASVTGWVSSGLITGGDGTLEVRAVYDTPVAGLTAVFAVAPPGPVAVSNGSFEVMDVPADGILSATVPATWAWVQLEPSGTAVNLYLTDGACLAPVGIAAPHTGGQYLLLHTARPAGSENATSAIHQDTPLLWSDLAVGDTLTVAAWTAYRSDLPNVPDVRFWLNSFSEAVPSALASPVFEVTDGGATAPGVWTERVWVHEVTQADLDAAAAHAWGPVNVAVGIVSNDRAADDPSEAMHQQVALDDVTLVHGRSSGPPVLAAVGPPDDARGIPVASNLVATFSKPVALTGAGSITLKNLSGGADIPVPLPGGVAVNGSTLTLDPPAPLAAGAEYAVEISADAIEDHAEPPQPFAGLPAAATPNWSFTASTAGPFVRVFLLGGQSNAFGVGAASELPTSPVNLRQPQPDVLFHHPGGPLTTLRPGSGVDFGPEVSFGRAVADASPGVTYAIIKHAEAGTNLFEEWAPGTGASYARFRDTVAGGLAALHAAGYATEIVGMLWHQGESDAHLGQQAAYQANLTAFIADIRSRYGANLPFLVGEIGNTMAGYEAALNAVIAAQQAVAAADPCTGFVPASDLPFWDDDVHFNTAGQIALGQRFAAGYADLNTFANWIARHPGAGGQAGLAQDPDGDGLGNGVEDFFGTDPSAFSRGLVAGAAGAGTFAFSHPLNGLPANDLVATYRWSKDLATFTPGGVAHEGTTVHFTPLAPAGGFVSVTATVVGAPVDRLFIDVQVTQH